MRTHKHFTVRCFLIAFVMLLTGAFSAVVAWAEPDIPEKKVFYLDGTVGESYIYLYGVSKTSAIKNLKNSKKSVADVFRSVNGDTAVVAIRPKKAGTTTVSFNVKYKGKTIKAKTKVIARKYVNPLKSLKIGSVNFTSQFKKTGHITLNRPLKGKLSIKLKAGYKILEMNVYSWSGGSTMKKVKNNKNVYVPKGKTLSIQVLPKGADEEEKMFLEIMID